MPQKKKIEEPESKLKVCDVMNEILKVEEKNAKITINSWFGKVILTSDDFSLIKYVLSHGFKMNYEELLKYTNLIIFEKCNILNRLNKNFLINKICNGEALTDSENRRIWEHLISHGFKIDCSEILKNTNLSKFEKHKILHVFKRNYATDKYNNGETLTEEEEEILFLELFCYGMEIIKFKEEAYPDEPFEDKE